jgi:integrase
MAKWIKTSKPGIRYREHATRKHGIHPDRYYVFNYRIGKDLVEGALGWASEGWTQEKAAEERSKLKKSAKRGGPRTLTEMRKLADTAMTFQQVVDEWEEVELKGKKSKAETLRLLEKDVLPPWGNLKVKDIKRRDIVLLRDRIKKRAPVTANRVHGALTRLFNFAAERGVIDNSPCNGIRKIPEKGRSRVLNNEEIKLLWNALDLDNREIDIYFNSKLALKMIILTGQRPGEVCGMRWEEITTSPSDFDADKGKPIWIIPKTRMKNGESNAVPLCPLALEVIESAKVISGNSEYVFKSSHLKNDSIRPHGLSSAMLRHWQEMGIEKRFTPHDLRRTLRTKLASLKVSDIVAERVLGHKLQGILAIYNQYHYVPEKREALEKWERELKKIIGIESATNANVISIEERRNHG